MKRIHITRNGMPGECKATVGKCPLGEHYDTIVEAAQAIEADNKALEVPKPARKALSAEEQTNMFLARQEIVSDLEAEIKADPEAFQEHLTAYTQATMDLDEAPDSLDRTARNRLYGAQSAAVSNIVMQATEAACGTENLPPALRGHIWSRAWEDGHSSGYSSVYYSYMEHAELAQAAYDAGRKELADKLETYAERLDTGIYPVQNPDGVIHSKQDKDVAKKIRDIIAR